jgi:hypothetical protein
MSLARRSILTRASLFVSVLLLCGPASAQRAVPAARPSAAPTHVSPPPIYHPPVMPAPVVRAPIIYAPISSAPRSGVFATPGRVGTSVVLPPVHPIHPIRPRPPLILIYSPTFLLGEPFEPFNFCWLPSCDWFWPFVSGYTNISSPGPTNNVTQVYQSPLYAYGGEREDFPQLFLKDGAILNVTDYWVVDGQLHFKLIEEIGQKPVEHTIPFEELNLQKTIDANTRRGFRFVLRNEPFDEYVRDHPEGPPPALTSPPE